MYTRFMLTLTIGLVGVCLVLMTLFETLFSAWDPVRETRLLWRKLTHGRSGSGSIRAEDILSEIEGRRKSRSAYEPHAPARAIDRLRDDLRDMREADQRVASPDSV